MTVYPERAEVHILDDEAAARAYIEQMWAEAMTVYRSGKYKLSFSMEMNRYLNAHQQDFMQEDTQAGMIYAYLEDYTGDRVCSKQLYEEALGNLNSPADWETRAICEIMNTGIAGGIIQGWVAYKSPKRYKKYGSQKAGSVSTKLRRRGRFSGNHGRRSPANGTSILKSHRLTVWLTLWLTAG